MSHDERLRLSFEVEQFLYHEARLLDDWRLDDWFDLFLAKSNYFVPPLKCIDWKAADPGQALFLVADDKEALRARIDRLKKKSAFVEQPRSLIRRLITNVTVLSSAEDEIEATSNFVVYRTRRRLTNVYVGTTHYRLKATTSGIRIGEKRAFLDMDVLEPQGSLGILL